MDLKLSWAPEVSGPPRKRDSRSRSLASADMLSKAFVPILTDTHWLDQAAMDRLLEHRANGWTSRDQT